MRSIGLTLPVGPECHKKVGFILDGGIASELTRIKRLLDSLRRERNIADYELSNGRAESATAVDLSLDMAREALMILGEYFPGKSKESAADEMRRYAMNVLKLPVK